MAEVHEMKQNKKGTPPPKKQSQDSNRIVIGQTIGLSDTFQGQQLLGHLIHK